MRAHVLSLSSAFEMLKFTPSKSEIQRPEPEILGRNMGSSVKTDAQSREKWDLRYNMTALHWAAYHGNLDSVRALCDLKASTTMQDNRYCAPSSTALRAVQTARSTVAQKPNGDRTDWHYCGAETVRR
eukprot:1498794-Rhodomonas_salina.1